jgi:deazaflavin-dependent oxidoreductase (nitroreductase family)
MPPRSDLYYDQVAQVVVPEWTSQRVTLVGDACQAVSLLAGQGASLAVAGAYVLGEQLATADSIDAGLARYDQVWRPIVEEKQRAGRRGAEWFLPKTEAQLWARRIMLAAGSLPVVDRCLASELLGKSHVRIRELARHTSVTPVTSTSTSTSNKAAASSRTGSELAGRPDARAMFARSPSPVLRVLFRAPRWLYRLRLGGLLGHRFALLTHRGRTSGRTYQTVLEVVHYDPRTQESVVCSGWGTRADWYLNIIASSPVAFETAGRRYPNPSFRALAPEENYPIVMAYVRRLPAMARPLAYRLGLDLRGPEDERRAHSHRLLMVAFGPRATRAEPEAEASSNHREMTPDKPHAHCAYELRRKDHV